MVAGLQVHRLGAGEMLAVQRPNVDDTNCLHELFMFIRVRVCFVA